MPLDYMAVAIDWLDTFRARDLETMLTLFTDSAEIECMCCAMTTIRGKTDHRSYWAKRFQDCVPTELDDLQPLGDGVVISYATAKGTVSANLRLTASGQIASLRLDQRGNMQD